MVKVSIPNRFQFRMMPEIRGFIFPKRGGEIHYIGGAEILPAPLTIEEEEQVMKKLGGDEDKEARSNLIEHNLRLVVYIAKKFDNTGVGVEDLISIGTIGLIKAINTFNPLKNIKLATYASRCIENEILMYLRRNNKLKLEVSIDENVISKDMEDEVDKKLLRMALSKLNKRERTIIELRFGINSADGEEKTQKEVADMMGISQSYISRLEKKIIRRLKKEIVRME